MFGKCVNITIHFVLLALVIIIHMHNIMYMHTCTHTHTGKLYDSLGQGVDAQFIQFPDDEKIIDIATAAQYMVALSENGNVYYWGKNQVNRV